MTLYVARIAPESTLDEMLSFYRVVTGRKPTREQAEEARRILNQARVKQQPSTS